MTEQLNPEQQTGYEHALVLALQANAAFDERKAAATQLAQQIEADPNQEFQHNSREMTAIATADENFKNFQFAASVLMPPRPAFETRDTSNQTETSGFANESVWKSMTPEQQAKASALRTALAAGELKKYGVTEDSLRVVATVAGKFKLIHTGTGIDMANLGRGYDIARSYESVMSQNNDKTFQVEVNGVIYDARKGMTDETYYAKVEDARERGDILPDSHKMSVITDGIWTWTMLTGEPPTTDGGVLIRRVRAGLVVRSDTYIRRPNRIMRVCPVVEIE